MIILNVNGALHNLDIDPDTPLLWVLNEHLGLTGTKFGCGIAECGACTVLINGQASMACQIPVQDVTDDRIVTIEGLRGPLARALQQAWIETDVVQCGYCQPAQILTAAALIESDPDPDDATIDREMSPVLCRCGTYQAIRTAIYRAAREYHHAR